MKYAASTIDLLIPDQSQKLSPVPMTRDTLSILGRNPSQKVGVVLNSLPVSDSYSRR